MKQLFTTILLAAIATMSFAQPVLPFTAPSTPKYYAVFGPQETVDASGNNYTPPQPSKLYEVNSVTGGLTKLGEGDMGMHVNALAYNRTDNFLYGIVDSTTGSLVPLSINQRAMMYRIGQNANMLRMGVITPPATIATDVTSSVFSFVGDMDAQGNYFFPAIVVHSYSIAPSAIDYDLFVGRIPASELLSPKALIQPIYTPMSKGNCAALIDDYVLAYCGAILQNQPRPNGGIQDWSINPYDNKLWSYIGNNNQFFKLALPDPAAPNNPVAIDCSPAPIGYPDLAGTELGGIYFNERGDMFATDPEHAKYYKFENCTSGNFCNNLTLVREYNQAFGVPAYPTFLNLRTDAASTVHSTITPTDQPFVNCTGAQFSIFSPADNVTVGGYVYPGNSQLYSVNSTTGELNQIGVNNMGKSLNGLAFNPVDRFLYAMSDSTWSARPIGPQELYEETKLYRIDNAGFPKLVQSIALPPLDFGTDQRSFILSQSADMDAEGNYYFLAARVNVLEHFPPYVPSGYTLYLGKIAGASLKPTTLPLAAPLIPTYYKIATTDCGGIFDGYIEDYLASVVEGRVRPRTGVQDWSINPKEKTLWSYIAREGSFFFVPLPSASATSVDARCSPIDPSLAMLGAGQSAQTSFYSNNGNSIFLTDATNGVFYELSNCAGATCATINPITTYGLAFSATKPDFQNLIGDGAGCTFASIDCNGAAAYHTLSPRATPEQGAELWTSTPSATNIPFTKINKITSGGTPLAIEGLLYNVTDSYLYGLSDKAFTGSPVLYKIDAYGNAQTVGNLPVPTRPASYSNTYTLPAPIPATPALVSLKSVVFSQMTTAADNGKAYLLATAYSFDKTDASVVGYDLLNYNIYVAEVDMSNPTVNTTFYEMDLNQPSFSCTSFVNTNLLNSIAFAAGVSSRPPALQDWAINPAGTTIWAFDGDTDKAVSISLPTAGGANVLPQCYDAKVLNNADTREVNGLHFAQDGSLYALDGTTGKAFSIDITRCPPDAIDNNCATIGSLFDLPGAGTPPVSVGLAGNSASCTSRLALPVTLLRFLGNNNQCSNELSWVTASERNNDRFELQKSVDGRNFATIAVVRGARNSNSPQTYSFTDNNISKTSYYRLRQIDFDGTTVNIGNIVALTSNCIKKPNVGIEVVFPNPTLASTTVLYNAASEQKGMATWTLLDAMGKVVLQNTTELQEDGNLISVDLKALPSGVYIFYLSGESWKSEAKRIIRR